MEAVVEKPPLTRDQKLAILQRDNPRKQRKTLELYLATIEEYEQAQGKIDSGGTVTAHPRTGAPLANPFLAVRDAAVRKITKTWPDVVTDGLTGGAPVVEPAAPQSGRARRQGPPAKAVLPPPASDEPDKSEPPNREQAWREARKNRIMMQQAQGGQRDVAQLYAIEVRLLQACHEEQEAKRTEEQRLLESAAWLDLRDRIFRVLEKHPAVLAEVLEAIKS